MKKYSYLFGPVLSRRFGNSLGVDLVPLKTCTMDCIFCQLGRTAKKTFIRKEYVPVELVNAEIADWLASGEVADCITLSGSGEPTLHSRFGDVIHFIHKHTTIPVLLLTNSSLLRLAPVRRAAARADIVKISLSAWDQASFSKINKPFSGITFERYLAGLQAFRTEFKGQLVMEVFLVRGLNSDKDDARKIAELASII
ncbi:MAG: radical SAM protein, partial [bacterium]